VTDSPTPDGPPAEITHLVRERIEARARRDWPRADAIKAQIEAAGWRVTDRGNRTSVSPAAPQTVDVDGELRYGSAAAVPSLLDAPATAAWTVVVVASEQPERVSRLLDGLRRHAPAGTRVVAVANDPSDAQVAALDPEAADRAPIDGTAPELLRTSTRLGFAAALNIALQRSAAEFVLIADTTAWPTGDALSPLQAALSDPTVAAAGAFGLMATEPGPLRPGALERVERATADRATDRADGDATALEAGWLAFRRSDYRELGPLDEHFVTPSWLDVWWTLRLRAGAEPEGAEYDEQAEQTDPGSDGDAAGASADGASADDASADDASADGAQDPSIEFPAPRRAVVVDLPIERDDVPWPPDRSRLNRRNMYRVLDRFGWREDLT
jgi:hypothetical protein